MNQATSTYNFKVRESEQRYSNFYLNRDERSSLFGEVRDLNGCEVAGAMVVLLEVCRVQRGFKGYECRLIPINYTFTDNDGQFMFGPLYNGKSYVVKIFKSNLNRNMKCFKGNMIIYTLK